MPDLLVGLDVETGGLDPAADALLSVGIYCGPCAGKEWQTGREWAQLILPEPGLWIDPEAAKKNGYSPEEWERRGAVSESVALVRLIEVLERWMVEEGTVWGVAVAHLAGHDEGFLRTALRRQGLEGTWEQVMRRGWRCSCATFRAVMDAGLLPETGASLDALNAARLLPRRTGIHKAEEDARLAYDGYVWLLGLIGGRGKMEQEGTGREPGGSASEESGALEAVEDYTPEDLARWEEVAAKR